MFNLHLAADRFSTLCPIWLQGLLQLLIRDRSFRYYGVLLIHCDLALKSRM